MNEGAKLLLEVTNEIADSDAPLKSFGPSLMQLGLVIRRLFNSGQDLNDIQGMTASFTSDGMAIDPWNASCKRRSKSAAGWRGA